MNKIIGIETHEGEVAHVMSGISHGDGIDWCDHCVMKPSLYCDSIPCMKAERPDHQDVVFVTAEQAALVRLRGEWRG